MQKIPFSQRVSLCLTSSGILFLVALSPFVALFFVWPQVALICMMPFAGYVLYLGYLKLLGNFHPIVPSEAYRSAMLTGAQLRRYHARKGFRSIINLRGSTEGKHWYDTQTALAKSLGVEQFDFGISARKPIEKERALALIQLMKDAPKPVLIHCKAGADRTGLASALYLAAIAGEGRARSERELTLWYGHFCVPHVSYSYAVRKNWNAYCGWLWPRG